LLPESEWKASHPNGRPASYPIYKSAHLVWNQFIASQRHWRKSHAGHLEAWDAAGHRAVQAMLRVRIAPDDYALLLELLDQQRLTVNERVSARIADAAKP
jgi:hypothetical protein